MNFKSVLNTNRRELTADADMISYNTKSEQTAHNYNTYPVGNLISNPFLLRGKLPAKITIYSGKVDYVHPLKKEAKKEAGAFLPTMMLSILHFDHYVDKWISDNSRSNHYVNIDAVVNN